MSSMENSVVNTGHSAGVRHVNAASRRAVEYAVAARLRMACPGLFPPPQRAAVALQPVGPYEGAIRAGQYDGPDSSATSAGPVRTEPVRVRGLRIRNERSFAYFTEVEIDVEV